MKKITGKIAVLGAGNIGLSIAEGIQHLSKRKIILTRKNNIFSEEEKEKFECMSDNKEAVSASKIVIVAVQPKQADDLFLEIKEVLGKRHLLISVISGIKIDQIEKIVGKIAIARAMPNITIGISQSMTCITFNILAKKYQALVESIFGSVGKTLLIPEVKFTEATVLCGSGTALVLKFIRAFMQACIQHGFNGKEAILIASQVVKGASIMIQENHEHPEKEIDSVTTPGGCTIYALAELEHAGFNSALFRAIKVGVDKAQKLYS